MGVKNKVFPSKSEQENFYKLKSTWEENYNIYQNLPFLNVLTPYDLIDRNTGLPIQMTDIEINRLKKTSIDFTLCDHRDRPIICIEFDGMQQGFNVGANYYPSELTESANPWRRQITELKLKVALGSSFPYFVVGSDQFKYISSEIKLTIVDGIIGTVLASKASTEKIGEGFDPTEMGYTEEEFQELTDHEQYEIIQDWVLGVEVDQEVEHNPIDRAFGHLD